MRAAKKKYCTSAAPLTSPREGVRLPPYHAPMQMRGHQQRMHLTLARDLRGRFDSDHRLRVEVHGE
jgi:GTP cyclohydrolase I